MQRWLHRLPLVPPYPKLSNHCEHDLKRVKELLVDTSNPIRPSISTSNGSHESQNGPKQDDNWTALQFYLESLVSGTSIAIPDSEHDVIASICACLLLVKSEPRSISIVLSKKTKDVEKEKQQTGDAKGTQHKQNERCMIGFALSYDKQWRYHSWTLHQNDGEVRDVESRLVYCGIDMNRLFVVYDAKWS